MNARYSSCTLKFLNLRFLVGNLGHHSVLTARRPSMSVAHSRITIFFQTRASTNRRDEFHVSLARMVHLVGSSSMVGSRHGKFLLNTGETETERYKAGGSYKSLKGFPPLSASSVTTPEWLPVPFLDNCFDNFGLRVHLAPSLL